MLERRKWCRYPKHWQYSLWYRTSNSSNTWNGKKSIYKYYWNMYTCHERKIQQALNWCTFGEYFIQNFASMRCIKHGPVFWCDTKTHLFWLPKDAWSIGKMLSGHGAVWLGGACCWLYWGPPMFISNSDGPNQRKYNHIPLVKRIYFHVNYFHWIIYVTVKANKNIKTSVTLHLKASWFFCYKLILKFE